jgi:hypothetical protein
MNCSTSTADTGCWWENSPDCYVAGIAFSGGPANVQNPRCFANLAVASRLYKWQCSFDNPPAGLAGSGAWDNQACWFLGDPSAQRSYVALVGCTFSRLPPSGNGYMAVDCYNTKYMIVDENTFGAPNSATGEQCAMFIKGGGNQEISVRKNSFSQSWATSQINFAFGSDGTGTHSTNQEACYNTLVIATLSGWDGILMMVNGAQNNTQPATAWSYRNTIHGIPAIAYQSVNVLTFTSDNDVIVHNATASGATGLWLGVNFGGRQDSFVNPATIPSIVYAINGVECQGNSSAGILDSNYLLTGTYRTNYLGLRGAEIA